MRAPRDLCFISASSLGKCHRFELSGSISLRTVLSSLVHPLTLMTPPLERDQSLDLHETSDQRLHEPSKSSHFKRRQAYHHQQDYTHHDASPTHHIESPTFDGGGFLPVRSQPGAGALLIQHARISSALECQRRRSYRSIFEDAEDDGGWWAIETATFASSTSVTAASDALHSTISDEPRKLVTRSKRSLCPGEVPRTTSQSKRRQKE